MTEQLLANGKASDQKKDYSKCYLSLAVILFICLIILGGFSYYYICYKKNDPNCSTENCLKASLDLLTSIDSSIDPCDDFFGFSCNKYVEKHTLYLTSQSSIREERMKSLLSGSGSEWSKGQQDFYTKCLDEGAIDLDFNNNILNLINELGGWPLLKGQWDHSKFNLTNFCIKCAELGLPFEWFFKISYGPSPDDETVSVVKIVKPDGLYQKIDDIKDAAYLELILTTAAQLDAYKPTSATEPTWIIDLEYKLEKLWSSYDPADEKPVSMDSLLSIFPKVDIPYLIENLTGDFLLPGNTTVIATNADLLRGVNALLSGYSEWTQVNFLIWKIVQSRGVFLSSPLKDQFGKFDNYYTEFYSDLSREGICSTEARKRFPLTTKLDYMNNFMDSTKIEKIMEMVDNIKKHYVDHIENSDWISNLTIPIVVDKINNMKVEIKEFDDREEDFKNLLVQLPGPEVDFSNSTIYEMLSALEKYNFKVRMLFMNETSVDPSAFTEEFDDAFKYIDETNELVLPPRVLEDELFLLDGPTYINYGVLGTLIAKEMARALHMDALAGIADLPDRFLWKNDSETDSSLFVRTRCIVDQYVHNGNEGHNDDIFSENYINLISLDIAYEAYLDDPGTPSQGLPGLEKYQPDQLFWIFYESQFCSGDNGDNPVPIEYRQLYPVLSSRYIAKLFACKENSFMSNNENKCIVL